MTNFLFKQYDRTYKNFDKCMACIEDIVLIAQKQENYEIGKRIEKLLNELEKVKDNNLTETILNSYFTTEEKLCNGKWAYTIKNDNIILNYLGQKEKVKNGYVLDINFNESEAK